MEGFVALVLVIGLLIGLIAVQLSTTQQGTRLGIALIGFVLASCTSLQVIFRESSFYAMDLTKYTALGFLISPESYTGEYESIGIVKYTIVPGAVYKKVPKYYSDGSKGFTEEWVIDKVELTTGLDSLYAISKRMGANAIINFTAITLPRSYQGILNPVTLEGYELTGFAIKRK
jgi:hypothetical protein